MSRKRIYYRVIAPEGQWWVRGIGRPVSLDDPAVPSDWAALDGRRARTMGKMLKLLRRCGPGACASSFMTIRGKRGVRELRFWEKVR